jgi:hypothetical protein
MIRSYVFNLSLLDSNHVHGSKTAQESCHGTSVDGKLYVEFFFIDLSYSPS